MFSLLWYETKESIINKDKRLIYIKHDITTTMNIQRVPLYIYGCLIIKSLYFMLFISIKHCLILHKICIKVLYKWSVVCCRLRAKKRNHLFFVFLCPICVGPSTVRNKQHSGRTDKSGWCFSTHRRKVCIYVLTTTMRTYSVTVKNTRPVQIQIIIFPREGHLELHKSF